MRKLRRLVVCAAATSAIVALTGAASAVSPPESTAAARAAAPPSPAHWKPWLLTSPSQFRLNAPPAAGSAQTKAELKQLLRLQKRTPAVLANIKKWCSQPAVIPWMQLELKLFQDYRPRVGPSARALALLGAGMYDAMIAASDSHDFYAKSSRPAPWQLDKRLKPALKAAAGSTYAPYDAAVAGAAETILPYLFPGEPRRTFVATADEAVNARLAAGLNYRSDLQQARALGQKVATLVIARGEADGHVNTGYSEGPFTGEQFWVPTPPEYEGAIGSAIGTWKTWLLANPRALWNVIPPPSPYGSPRYLAQLKAVMDTAPSLTANQRQIANFWDDGPGTFTPPGHWEDIALQLIKSYKLSGPMALKAVAYLGVAQNDAVISWFGLKYHYSQVRPITAIWRLGADGTLHTQAQCDADPASCPNRDRWYSIITTPAFPSYPAGHPTLSGLGGKLLTYFFPKAANTLNELANQVALARLYGGIHYPEDNSAGLTLGRALADDYISRARADR